jgi:hypothetical protein
MANVKITDLPLITGITINDVIPIVDVDTVVTSKVTIGDLKDYFDTPFTGGTVSGDTEFTNGLTANTISATTYFNLPTDVFVTGGTYSNGDITFTNNTGGTFNVSGLFTGNTDVYVTGGTYNNNTFTYTNNIGGTFDVSFNSVSGLTSNGTIESNAISATTISGGTLYGDGSNLSGIVASGVSYDNNVSGLLATDVQNVIDELSVGNYQYQKGNAFNNFMVNSAAFGNSTNGVSSNLLLAFPIYVQKDTTIDAVRIGVATASVGNTVIGLYTAVNGLPDTKIFQTTEFNNNVTGYQVISVGTQTLKKGIYFVSYLMNSTYSAVHVPISAVPNVIGNSGITTSSGDGPSSLVGRSLTYTSTLPTTWGTPTTLYSIAVISNVLQVEFRIP